MRQVQTHDAKCNIIQCSLIKELERWIDDTVRTPYYKCDRANLARFEAGIEIQAILNRTARCRKLQCRSTARHS